jgi:hypothetical protein
MGANNQNVFGVSSGSSWRRAVLKATYIDGALLFLAIGMLVSPLRADNPAGAYAAFVLQFPASLLALPLNRFVVQLFHASESQGFVASAATVAVLQYVLIVLLIRRPWRRVERPLSSE